jgi:hypothetical protein
MLAIATTNANDEAGGGKPYKEGFNLRTPVCPTMCYALRPALKEMASEQKYC